MNVRISDLVWTVIILLLLAGPLAAETTGTYKGELALPVDLYSSDGVLLEKGKFEIEVRNEKGNYALIFARKDKTLARVGGRTVSGDQLQEVFQGMQVHFALRHPIHQHPPKKMEMNRLCRLICPRSPGSSH
jgi:hypothetical protein